MILQMILLMPTLPRMLRITIKLTVTKKRVRRPQNNKKSSSLICDDDENDENDSNLNKKKDFQMMDDKEETRKNRILWSRKMMWNQLQTLRRYQLKLWQNKSFADVLMTLAIMIIGEVGDGDNDNEEKKINKYKHINEHIEGNKSLIPTNPCYLCLFHTSIDDEWKQRGKRECAFVKWWGV